MLLATLVITHICICLFFSKLFAFVFIFALKKAQIYISDLHQLPVSEQTAREATHPFVERAVAEPLPFGKGLLCIRGRRMSGEQLRDHL